MSGLITNYQTNTKIEIKTGSAADSSNTVMIALPSSCQVDISQGGMGGLDAGTAQVQAGATYHFFVVAQGDFTPVSQTVPPCIASTSTSPNFYKAAQTSSLPPSVTLSGYVTQSAYQIVNVTPDPCSGTGSSFKCTSFSPFGGLQIGDYISDPAGLGAIQQNTQITALNSYNVSNIQVTAASGADVTVNSVSGLYIGMVVGNCTAVQCSGHTGSLIPRSEYAVISYIHGSGTNCGSVSPPCMELTQSVNGTTGYLVASGASTITMSNPANNSSSDLQHPDTIQVYNDRYRLVASAVTDSNSHILPYHQDDDTFYLDTPVADIINYSLAGTSAYTIALASVPIGFKVEALGRCVATSSTSGTFVHIFPTTDTTRHPADFPTVPGYSIKAGTSPPSVGTAFPYRINTDTSASITAQASANATLNCMTDGYVFNR